MCKILAIQGSYRNNGKTTTMLNYAVEKAKAQNNEVTYIMLYIWCISIVPVIVSMKLIGGYVFN